MREARLIETRAVLLADIEQGSRIRGLSNASIEAICTSFKELGRMVEPIHIRRVRHQDNRLVLIAGAHRLAAAQKLGWTEIEAKIWDCADDWAHLLEIDDNLTNPALAPLDLCILLAQRKRVYEKLHPETRHGGLRGNQHTGGRQTELNSFCQNIAEKQGISERQVRKITRAGAGLSADEIARLRAAPRPPTLKDLLDLSNVVEDEEREATLAIYSMDGASKMKDAHDVATSDGGANVISIAEKRFERLCNAWAQANPKDRKRFVARFATTIQPYLADKTADIIPLPPKGQKNG